MATTTTAAATTPAAKPTTTTTPAATPTVTTAPAATPPAPSVPIVGARNPSLWPFASDSPWNTPIGSGAPLEGAAGPLTSKVRVGSLLTKDGSANVSITTWMNASTVLAPRVWTSANDPLMTITAPWDPTVTVRIPASAQPADGTDRHLHVVQPDGRTMIELWAANKTSATTLTAGRVEVVDLYGSGLGPDNGVRAYGGSAVGGLIRRWEVDPSDPKYTDGVIRHAVAIAVPAGMLRYGGGADGIRRRPGTERPRATCGPRPSRTTTRRTPTPARFRWVSCSPSRRA